MTAPCVTGAANPNRIEHIAMRGDFVDVFIWCFIWFLDLVFTLLNGKISQTLYYR
jgi:hypothetical protein